MVARNEAIGEVECPVKGCSEVARVFRFRERGETQRSIVNRRFAGKLYARCTKHGRIGGDNGDADMQAYILEHAKIWGPKDQRAAPEQPAAEKPAPAAAPAAKPKPAPRRSAPRPAAAPPAPAAPEKPKRKGWGFFDE